MSLLSLFTPTPLKRPVVQATSSDPDFDRSYDQLATKLGIRSRSGIAQSKLLTVLAEESIDVYELSRVERYMDRKGYWGWFPLRTVDAARTFMVSRETFTPYSSLYGGAKQGVYQNPIPYPVLLTVEKILERCPDANFFIAAPDKHPDPFLAVVHLSDSKMYVVERWDEPSFR